MISNILRIKKIRIISYNHLIFNITINFIQIQIKSFIKTWKQLNRLFLSFKKFFNLMLIKLRETEEEFYLSTIFFKIWKNLNRFNIN